MEPSQIAHRLIVRRIKLRIEQSERDILNYRTTKHTATGPERNMWKNRIRTETHIARALTEILSGAS